VAAISVLLPVRGLFAVADRGVDESKPADHWHIPVQGLFEYRRKFV
jgi:hypothetical protein